MAPAAGQQGRSSQETVTSPDSPKFYAYGRDAYPTRASINQVCRNFQRGQCYNNTACKRIHPRSVTVIPLHPSTNTEPGTQPSSKPLDSPPIATLASSNLRYSPGRGFVKYDSDADIDSERTSDDSLHISTHDHIILTFAVTGSKRIAKVAHIHVFTFMEIFRMILPSTVCILLLQDTVSAGAGKQDQSDMGQATAYGTDKNPTLVWNITSTPDKTSDEVDADEVTYPPPKFNEFCRNWMLNRCVHGASCLFFHGDVNYEPPVEGLHPPPQNLRTCRQWKLNSCFLGYACHFVHEDLSYDAPPSRHSSERQQNETPLQKSEVCHQWIRGSCTLGRSCEYRHLELQREDLDHSPTQNIPLVEEKDETVNDPPVGQRPAPKKSETCIQWLRGSPAGMGTKICSPPLDIGGTKVSTEERTWSVIVRDHAKVKLGSGFQITDLQTGFETPWIYLGNIPSQVQAQEVLDLLLPFGEVVDIRLPIHNDTPTMLVRARFSISENAQAASAALHRTEAFGVKITARLPVHDALKNNTMFTDTSACIQWEAPSRTAYCGYSTAELAEAGIIAARRNVFRDRYVHGTIHVGLPVVGVVTVRFRGLPIDVKKEDMAFFAKPDDVVWAQPNYKHLDLATAGIKRILQQNSELLDFVVQPPPYRHGKIRAWAHFRTASAAKSSCARLNGRKPMFSGMTRVSAEHIQSLTFSVSATTYAMVRDDIQVLHEAVLNAHGTSMSVIERPTPNTTSVKLSGKDLKELGQLKAELEHILNWETIYQGEVVAWDSYFAHPAGTAFLANLECNTSNVTIRADISRRMIRLLGSSTHREVVKQQVLAKVVELQAQQVRTIPLDGWLFGYLMRKNLTQLQGLVGSETLVLDFSRRCLVVRGSDAIYRAVCDAVHQARQAQLHPTRRQNAASSTLSSFRVHILVAATA
ncbi:hypothetical protein H0H93_009023 [Arthromyces matolae]|nr:hypothetical protein H0H93_009023 [Arthromyces matolae]